MEPPVISDNRADTPGRAEPADEPDADRGGSENGGEVVE